jgi:hypothetical protein
MSKFSRRRNSPCEAITYKDKEQGFQWIKDAGMTIGLCVGAYSSIATLFAFFCHVCLLTKQFVLIYGLAMATSVSAAPIEQPLEQTLQQKDSAASLLQTCAMVFSIYLIIIRLPLFIVVMMANNNAGTNASSAGRRVVEVTEEMVAQDLLDDAELGEFAPSQVASKEAPVLGLKPSSRLKLHKPSGLVVSQARPSESGLQA